MTTQWKRLAFLDEIEAYRQSLDLWHITIDGMIIWIEQPAFFASDGNLPPGAVGIPVLAPESGARWTMIVIKDASDGYANLYSDEVVNKAALDESNLPDYANRFPVCAVKVEVGQTVLLAEDIWLLYQSNAGMAKKVDKVTLSNVENFPSFMTIDGDLEDSGIPKKLVSLHYHGGTGADDVAINGTFDADTDWTKGTDVTIHDGEAYCNHAGSTSLDQTVPPLIAGILYKVTFWVSGWTEGQVRFTDGTVNGIWRSAVAIYEENFLATGTAFGFEFDDFVGKIDNVSIVTLDESPKINYSDLNGAPSIPATTAENDFQVGGVAGTLGTWVTKTYAQIKALFKGYFDTIYQPVPINYAPTVITFGSATQEYDIDGITWVAATAGIPDAASHLLPASLIAIATPYDSKYLAIREKTGAASATNPLTVQFTFETVTTFNVIKFRCRYVGSSAHEIVFELYNGSTWDIFDTFSNTADYQLHSLEVLVPATYVIAGTVLGRFRHLDNGVATHYLLIDYIVIGSGGGAGGDSIQSAHQTPFSAAGTILATDVQAALEELDAEKAALAGLNTQTFDVAAATAVAMAPRADQIQLNSLGAYTTGGTSTAFTFATLATPIALTTGERWTITFNATAGATPTLNRDAKGAIALKYYNSAGAKVACGATTIISGMIADVIYDGTDYVVMLPLFYSHPNHSGDVTSTGDGATAIGAGKVTLAMQANMATSSVVYRKSVGAGAPEVNTIATLKTDLAYTAEDVGAIGVGTKVQQILDDAVYSFTPADVIGFVLVGVYTSATKANVAIASYRCTSTSHMVNMGTLGPNINLTTGSLGGTTGTDGKITVSCHTDNKIYIENRLGNTIHVSVTTL